MAKRLDIDAWEAEFIKLFNDQVEEEPLYEYVHLYKKGLSPAEAVKAYLKENPDYAEKLDDLKSPPASASAPASAPASSMSPEEFLRRAKEIEAREAAKKRLSEFCPNCARHLAGKKFCKCGYKRKKGE